MTEIAQSGKLHFSGLIIALNIDSLKYLFLAVGQVIARDQENWYNESSRNSNENSVDLIMF